MLKDNNDTVLIRGSNGEQIASNAALDNVLGREIIPAANRAALVLKQGGKMKPQRYKDGTMTGLGIQGLRSPTRASKLDTGNGVQGNTAIPGVNRVGNTFSQASGFRPKVITQPGHPQRYGLGAYVAPEGYADGTLEEEGVRPNPLINFVQGIINADSQPEPNKQPQRQVHSAPTFDEARGNYELQRGIKPIKGYAYGSDDPRGIGYDDDINTLGTGANLISAQLAKAPQNANNVLNRIPQQKPQPVQQSDVTLTGKGGLSTLSGDGFSVSSRSPGLGAYSTPESLAGLDSRIAYNQTQGAKDQFAKNAEISQARYDDYNGKLGADKQAANLENLQRIALYGDNNGRQGFTGYFASNRAQKAAQNLLGINTDAIIKSRELGQNQRQFDAQNAAGLQKAQYDHDAELAKLNQPKYLTPNTYNADGQISGQDVVAIDPRTNTANKISTTDNDIHKLHTEELRKVAAITDPGVRSARLKQLSDVYLKQLAGG